VNNQSVRILKLDREATHAFRSARKLVGGGAAAAGLRHDLRLVLQRDGPAWVGTARGGDATVAEHGFGKEDGDESAEGEELEAHGGVLSALQPRSLAFIRPGPYDILWRGEHSPEITSE
jgi:hypothetical protein